MAQSRIRINFSAKSEASLNQQINTELYASYVYQAMAAHFNRDDVALKGFEKFFKKLSEEEREHSEKIIKYINLRGGSVILQDVQKPEKDKWGSCEEALEDALGLEKKVYENILNLHKIASESGDPHMCDWLEEDLLKEQVESLYKLSHYLTNIKRVGPGIGEYIFDKETLDDDARNAWL